MGKVKVLDCTLRDGGYCNSWEFGLQNSRKIISGLQEAGIEIIECGFLTNRIKYVEGTTKFTRIDEFSDIIPHKKKKELFVCMVNYGEYELSKLPCCDGKSIDGIRVAFHKKNYKDAMRFCEEIKAKGYLVFVQAMVSISYTDSEFLELIALANLVKPFAFYIVDSFGVMKRRDMERLFWLVDHNLDENILLGFHSHNNMQLAYSNAQIFSEMKTSRELIVDTSVYGMGRGAGNLNTELFVEYLNDNYDMNYIIKPLLKIMDTVLEKFYKQNYWGYSLPQYLSAKNNCHPNYGSYLSDMNKLTVENMEGILSMVEEEKKIEFDKNYIVRLYDQYMSYQILKDDRIHQVQEHIKGKHIILIGPGKSIINYKNEIYELCNDVSHIVISINFSYLDARVDYIFIGNQRRYDELPNSDRKKSIITSNIRAEECKAQFNYSDLLNSYEYVKDNSGMMAIQFLIKSGVERITIAGIDGYSMDYSQNYASDDMTTFSTKINWNNLNNGLRKALRYYETQIPIQYIGRPKLFEKSDES